MLKAKFVDTKCPLNRMIQILQENPQVEVSKTKPGNDRVKVLREPFFTSESEISLIKIRFTSLFRSQDKASLLVGVQSGFMRKLYAL